MSAGPAHDEAKAVAARYARRDVGDRYSPLRPEVWQARQERERAMLALFQRHLRKPVAELTVLEVGCGAGDNLLDLLRLGFDPARLVANELLPERAAMARCRLPSALRLLEGDALRLPLPDAGPDGAGADAGGGGRARGSGGANANGNTIETGFDIVLQSTVFSSILDDAFQQRLAERMWRWLRPGGAVLWYDFTVDNPRNADVRGVPLARLRELFPSARIDARRVTLAPPLARRVVRLHPAAWRWCNAVPLLRTHLMAWVAKPG